MPKQSGSGADKTVGDPRDADFEQLLSSVRRQSKKHTGPLFRTDAKSLYDVYIANLPEDERQSHTCAACQNFFRRYGDLVAIDQNGKLHSVLWAGPNAPNFYAGAVNALKAAVESANVMGVFVSNLAILGTALTPTATKDWTHFSVELSENSILKSPLLSPFQAMAEKRQDHKNMVKALDELSGQSIATAVKILKSNALYRNEKVLAGAEWLKQAHAKYTSKKNSAVRENILWLEIANAPAGFCHPRSSMLGTLLEDIESGKDFEEVKSRFEQKMHPLQYQRPQAAPSAANIARAEKIFKELGAEQALKRRYARLNELVTIWTSKEVSKASRQDASKSSSIFNMVQPKPERSQTGEKSSSVKIPPLTVTWQKFKTTILDEANVIEYYAPYQKCSFGTIVTAVDSEAPPLFQWDSPEQRNPFSFYLYIGGSYPADWNLKADSWCKINAVTTMPPHWYSNKFTHHHNSILFVIDKAKDVKYKNAGLAIFPEDLKAQFREVRSTIEAYSNKGTIAGFDESSASGILFSSHGADKDFLIRVTTADGSQEYRLDRWD